ncbi:hypothetical protein L210DRAFT_271394 [Boletus edulis BED1]|uniref:Uncharacterized protein n=1 Tax=Boletus edulis BED1 TaxID=1328754 RepID=A0AAD4GL42_BOLED|nr:hypothetical protein L210DRAFT_271394 [Boletus edulis BED1]
MKLCFSRERFIMVVKPCSLEAKHALSKSGNTMRVSPAPEYRSDALVPFCKQIRDTTGYSPSQFPFWSSFSLMLASIHQRSHGCLGVRRKIQTGHSSSFRIPETSLLSPHGFMKLLIAIIIWARSSVMEGLKLVIPVIWLMLLEVPWQCAPMKASWRSHELGLLLGAVYLATGSCFQG